jgi:hypothetical protein
LYKRRLGLDVLLQVSLEGILELCRAPQPFEPRFPSGVNETAAADWLAAEQEAKWSATPAPPTRVPDGPARLNRLTLEFIRTGQKAWASMRPRGCLSLR